MKRIGYIITIVIMLAGFQSFLNAKEVLNKDRFVTFDNGTVLDTKTGLMWASHDNGYAVTWQEAKEYCDTYRGGGYSDWRMPKQNELAQLYDNCKPGYRPECAVYEWKVYITNSIRLTGCAPWAAETDGSEAACFLFDYGCKSWMHKSVAFILRGLPVRDNK